MKLYPEQTRQKYQGLIDDLIDRAISLQTKISHGFFTHNNQVLDAISNVINIDPELHQLTQPEIDRIFSKIQNNQPLQKVIESPRLVEKLLTPSFHQQPGIVAARLLSNYPNSQGIYDQFELTDGNLMDRQDVQQTIHFKYLQSCLSHMNMWASHESVFGQRDTYFQTVVNRNSQELLFYTMLYLHAQNSSSQQQLVLNQTTRLRSPVRDALSQLLQAPSTDAFTKIQTIQAYLESNLYAIKRQVAGESASTQETEYEWLKLQFEVMNYQCQ